MRHIILLVLAAPLFAACTPVQASTLTSQPAVVDHCGVPRRIVTGVDDSGSYDHTQFALDQAAALVEAAACPSDTWFIRHINADSYAPSAAIRTEAFAAVPAPPASPANPFARRSYAEKLALWGVDARKFTAQKKDLAAYIREQSPPKAEATDVVGFLVKAGELLANTPPGARPMAILFTDGLDNVGIDEPFDLHGATVLLLAFEADDVGSARVREEWATLFHESNAGAVLFRDTTEPPPDDLDSLTPTQPSGGP